MGKTNPGCCKVVPGAVICCGVDGNCGCPGMPCQVAVGTCIPILQAKQRGLNIWCWLTWTTLTPYKIVDSRRTVRRCNPACPAGTGPASARRLWWGNSGGTSIPIVVRMRCRDTVYRWWPEDISPVRQPAHYWGRPILCPRSTWPSVHWCRCCGRQRSRVLPIPLSKTCNRQSVFNTCTKINSRIRWVIADSVVQKLHELNHHSGIVWSRMKLRRQIIPYWYSNEVRIQNWLSSKSYL